MMNWRTEVPNDSIVIIDQLISLRDQIVDKTRTSKVLGYLYFIFTIVIVIYSIYCLYGSTSIVESSIAFGYNISFIFWFCLTIYFYRQYLKTLSQIKSTNNSLEKFRIEVIDHLRSTWYTNEQSEIRDAISEELEGRGINVRYKSQ